MSAAHVTFAVHLDGSFFFMRNGMAGVPRQGEMVELEPGGWELPVQVVQWSAHNGTTYVELGTARDTHNEGLAEMLVKAGWERP